MPQPAQPLGEDLTALVARTEGVQPWRRVFHAATGVALAFGPGALGIQRGAVVAILGVGFAALIAADFARLGSERLNTLFFRAFPSMASPREAVGVASSTWYALGALLSYALFPLFAMPALLVLALADPAASVIGRRLNGRRLGKGSVPGSLAFFLVALAVLLSLVPPIPAVAVAAVATLSEVAPRKLDDNLVVPLAVGLALQLMM